MQYDVNRDGFVEIEYLKKLWQEQSGLLVHDFPQPVLDEILERWVSDSWDESNSFRHPGILNLLRRAGVIGIRTEGSISKTSKG